MNKNNIFKNIMACGIASVMMFASSVSAFAAYGEMNEVENLSKPSYEKLNQKDSYRKMLLSQEPIFEDGEQVAIVNRYMYIPRTPMLLTADYMQSVYEDEFLPINGGYVRLTGYFMYDYKKVSCTDVSVTHDISKYHQKSLKTSGNGTRKSTVKLSFSHDSYAGIANRTLSVSCTKDGKNGK